MRVRIVLLILAASLLRASESYPCSCFFPEHYGFLIHTSRELPANATGLVWLGGREPTKEDFEVVMVAGDEERPVPFELTPIEVSGDLRAYLVALTRPTSPGERYRFRTALFNSYPPSEEMQQREVVVSSASLNLTASSIRYELGPSTNEMISLPAGGSCSMRWEARTVRGRVTLPSDVEPFREHLLFTTILDGASRWQPTTSLCARYVPGRSWMGAGEEMFYRTCRSIDPLSGGRHRTAQEVSFPAGGQTVTTRTEQFEMDCPNDGSRVPFDPDAS